MVFVVRVLRISVYGVNNITEQSQDSQIYDTLIYCERQLHKIMYGTCGKGFKDLHLQSLTIIYNSAIGRPQIGVTLFYCKKQLYKINGRKNQHSYQILARKLHQDNNTTRPVVQRRALQRGAPGVLHVPLYTD